MFLFQFGILAYSATQIICPQLYLFCFVLILWTILNSFLWLIPHVHHGYVTDIESSFESSTEQDHFYQHGLTFITTCINNYIYGPLTRYVKLQVEHAPGMPGKFSPAAVFRGNRYLAIPACITARAWRTCRDACRDRLPAVTGKTFPAFPAHAHLQFCVSGKRSITQCVDAITHPFPSFNGATVEVWEWISNFILYFTGHVIAYPCCD